MKNRLNWNECFQNYLARIMRGTSGRAKLAYRTMMTDFRGGKQMPCGIETWDKVFAIEFPGEIVPKLCPPSWLPRGSSYAALTRKSPNFCDIRLESGTAKLKNPENFAGKIAKIKARSIVPIKHEKYEFDDNHNNMLVARTSETGPDMIKNYGKIEAVIEMFNDGAFTAVGALARISKIVNGEVAHV
jgi:hypothetical protein